MTARTVALTHERLQELLHYDPETGVFTWKVNHSGVQAGLTAGCISKSTGYVIIRCDKCPYLSHRLAWFYTYGEWPSGRLDHKDTIKTHNWMSNLRKATPSQNGQNRGRNSNNTTGIPGISWDKDRLKYSAYINIAYKKVNLGRFSKFEDAVSARHQAEIKYFGEFRHSA